MNASIYRLQDRLASRVTKFSGQKFALSEHSKKGVMILEDNDPTREMLATILTSNGYHVFEAYCETQAIKVWKQNFPQIDLLLADICIPYRTTGIEIAKAFLAEKSWLKVIYTSGFDSEIAAPEKFRLVEGENFVQKPFSPDYLLQTIKKVFPERPKLLADW
ncbi:MAG: response regulator [Verrucomicrobiota bacterium]